MGHMGMMGSMGGDGMSGMSGMPGMSGMGTMDMDKMEMMGMMGMAGKGMPGMGKMQQAAALPGFPGASHIYHVGATGFFLDHPEHVKLTDKQKGDLGQVKEHATDAVLVQRVGESGGAALEAHQRTQRQVGQAANEGDPVAGAFDDAHLLGARRQRRRRDAGLGRLEPAVKRLSQRGRH